MNAVEALRIYEIRDPKTEQELADICNLKFVSEVCDLMHNWFSKKSPYEDETAWELVESLPVSSAFLKQLIHYGQIIYSGDFKQFDYGNDNANIAHYGSTTVP